MSTRRVLLVTEAHTPSCSRPGAWEHWRHFDAASGKYVVGLECRGCGAHWQEQSDHAMFAEAIG